MSTVRIGQGIQITWLGHAAFKLRSPQGTVVIIDPWFEGNPMAACKAADIDKADFILVTHAHWDHFGDVLSTAEQTGAQLVCMPEIAGYLQQKGLKEPMGMNKGGTYQTKGISITMVDANHSSSISEGGQTLYGGEPAGFVVTFENGCAVYHAGDTGVFGGMKIIGELYRPQIAILPIGSHYVMGPKEATYACRLLKPRFVIPMHYGTFPVLTGTPEEFEKLMADQPEVKVVVIKPGETVE